MENKSETVRVTHKLEWELEEVRTSQDMERKQVSKGNSLPGEVRGQDWS